MIGHRIMPASVTEITCRFPCARAQIPEWIQRPRLRPFPKRYPFPRRRDSLRTSVNPDDSQRRASPSPLPGSPRSQVLDESVAMAGTAPPASLPDGNPAEDGFALTSLTAQRRPPEKDASDLTPFMRQWTAAKRQNPDALLFFRMGEFYGSFTMTPQWPAGNCNSR